MSISIQTALRKALPLILCILFTRTAARLSAAAQEEAVQERAEYLSERGVVLPTHEVRIDELLAGFDFQYPDPDEDVGIYLYSANKLLPLVPGPQIIMIGVQGKRFEMEGLAPLDIVLAVDKSGSMAEPDKIEWVKESLEILIDTLRDDDRLCLTVFDDEGSVVLPSTRVGEGDFRDRFRDAVQGISAQGGSDLTAGLRTALDAADPGAADSGGASAGLNARGWSSPKPHAWPVPETAICWISHV